MQIKICDIKDVHTARLCGNAEVEMIGLHAIWKLKRKNIKPYRLICDEIRMFYPKTSPVLVTKLKEPQKLAEILKRIKFKYIQMYVLDESSLTILKNKLNDLESNHLSNDINPAQIRLLDELADELQYIKKQTLFILNRDVKFIFAIPILGIDIKFTKYIIRKTKTFADLFLLDTSVMGGTGIIADIDKTRSLIKEAQPNETFIAGGLNPENIQSILQGLKPLYPNGVDVQSGVADTHRKHRNPKNPQLIIDFISRVRSQKSVTVRIKAVDYPDIRNSLISWAITDLRTNGNLSRTFSVMQKTDIDTVHIDFSNGSMAPNFISMPFNLLEQFTYLFPCMNYDIHLFIADIKDQYSVISECQKRNLLLKTVYFHVLPDDKELAERLDSVAGYCRGLGIKLGMAVQSTQFTTDTLRQLYEAVFARKTRPAISEISLITHSRRHPLASSIVHDRKILNSLLHNNEMFSVQALMSIDRDINLEKAKGLLKTEWVNQIIVGKDINDKMDLLLSTKTEPFAVNNMQNHLNRYRKVITDARNRNAN